MANPGADTSVQRCATHAGAQSPPVLTVNTSDPTRLPALSTRSGCSFASNSPTPTDVNEASKGKSSSPYSQRDEQDASVLLSLAEERDSRARSHSLDKDTKVSELPPAVPGATAPTQAVIFPTPGCSVSPQSRVVNVSAGLSSVQEAVCAGSVVQTSASLVSALAPPVMATAATPYFGVPFMQPHSVLPVPQVVQLAATPSGGPTSPSVAMHAAHPGAVVQCPGMVAAPSPPVPPAMPMQRTSTNGSMASYSGEQDEDDGNDSYDGNDVEMPRSKRQKHNIAERRRTCRLNTLFEELNKTLSARPELFSEVTPRSSKADILIGSIACVNALIRHVDHLNHQVGQMRPSIGAQQQPDVSQPHRTVSAPMPCAQPPPLPAHQHGQQAVGAVLAPMHPPAVASQQLTVTPAAAEPTTIVRIPESM